MAPQYWEVVGGADKGGILVRDGQSTTSKQLEDRLATGSCVEELERSGDRIRYKRLSGAGPETGWVSTSLKGKELLKSVDVPPAPATSSSSAAEPSQGPAATVESKAEIEEQAQPVKPEISEAEKAAAAKAEDWWMDPARKKPSPVDAHILADFLQEKGDGQEAVPPEDYKGGQLPVMPRTVGLPTYAAVPEKAKKNFPEKARKPMIRLYCFPGAADNYMLWLELATSAPAWCEVAVYEPRAHGFRPDEPWDLSLEERAEDAFRVMRPAFETHAKGGVSEGAPFGFLSHGVGGQFMALLAHKLKQELALEPLVVFANDGPAPNVPTLSDEGYRMLCEDVLGFYKLFQPDTVRQYEAMGGKGSKNAEALIQKWSRGLRLFEEHARRTIARGAEAVYHQFDCDLHVLVAKHTVDLDLGFGQLPEDHEQRQYWNRRKAITGSAPDFGGNWDRDGFKKWKDWAAEDFYYHEVETDHMTIKNSPLMQQIVFKELAGFCGMDY